MPEPIRVLHVTETAVGGVGAYLRNLVPLQAETLGEENVRLIFPSDEAYMLEGVAEKHLLAFERNGRGLKALKALATTLSTEIDRFRPDIIHIHSTFAGLVARGPLLMKVRRSKVVYCPHGWSFLVDFGAGKQRAARAVERLLALATDAVVAVSRSDEVAGLDAGIAPSKVRYVPNGVPAQSPAPGVPADWAAPPDRLRILFVGRFDRQKGIDLLEASIAPLGHKVTVMAVGRAVSGAAPSPPANMRVHDWMTPSDLESWYSSCDLVMIPSRWEGLPLVALEAMRAGKAILSSTVGGLPEAVEDGVTGVLVPDLKPESFQAVLDRLDRDTLQTMGHRAHLRFLERFAMDRVERDLRKVYAEVLGLRPVQSAGVAST